jgi:hypothetical protein
VRVSESEGERERERVREREREREREYERFSNGGREGVRRWLGDETIKGEERVPQAFQDRKMERVKKGK